MNSHLYHKEAVLITVPRSGKRDIWTFHAGQAVMDGADIDR